MSDGCVLHDRFLARLFDRKLGPILLSVFVTLFFGGHSECAEPALLMGKTWLDSLADLP